MSDKSDLPFLNRLKLPIFIGGITLSLLRPYPITVPLLRLVIFGLVLLTILGGFIDAVIHVPLEINTHIVTLPSTPK